MKTPLLLCGLLLFAALCASGQTNSAAEKEASDRSVDLFLAQNRNSDLEVTRTNIGEKDHWWLIQVKGGEFRLQALVFDSKGHMYSHEMAFDLAREKFACQMLDKFTEWERIASTNNAVPFKKTLGQCAGSGVFGADGIRTLTFAWEDLSAMGEGHRSSIEDSQGGLLFKEDIVHFREMIRALPEMKAELVQKIRNREAQKNLFK
jgi:hypothetical protein